MKGFTDENVPDQSGRCFVVTGANTGIGFETSRVLATRGARVVLACRDRGKAEAAMKRIGSEVHNADLGFVPLDQGDLASVRTAVEALRREPRLDVLINNAGVMATSYALTSDGFEQHIGVNHLGTFALTLPLLPKLAETPGSRVVVTSSVVHASARIDFDSFTRAEGPKPSKQYSQSKLANLLFLTELDRRLKAAALPVVTVGCHPGLAATELSRDMSAVVKLLAPLMRFFVNSPLQGAWPTLQAATEPDIASGGYYGPQKFGGSRGPSGPAKRSDMSRSGDLAEQLWEVSAKLTGVDPNIA